MFINIKCPRFNSQFSWCRLKFLGDEGRHPQLLTRMKVWERYNDLGIELWRIFLLIVQNQAWLHSIGLIPSIYLGFLEAFVSSLQIYG